MKNPVIAALGCLAVATCATPALSQSYAAYGAPTAFEGIYAGAYAGGMFDPGPNATLGALAGANFLVVDSVYAGAEVQGGASMDGATTTWDALMLAKGGALLAPDVLVYGALGGGFVAGSGSWAAGGGAELLATDSLGVRGELLGTGNWGGGWSATKITAGVVMHVK